MRKSRLQSIPMTNMHRYVHIYVHACCILTHKEKPKSNRQNSPLSLWNLLSLQQRQHNNNHKTDHNSTVVLFILHLHTCILGTHKLSADEFMPAELAAINSLWGVLSFQ